MLLPCISKGCNWRIDNGSIVSVDPVSSAVLRSWTIEGRVSALLLAIAAVYILGWVRMRRLRTDDRDGPRLGFFLAGLTAIFLAVESPLEAFDTL